MRSIPFLVLQAVFRSNETVKKKNATWLFVTNGYSGKFISLDKLMATVHVYEIILLN